MGGSPSASRDLVAFKSPEFVISKGRESSPTGRTASSSKLPMMENSRETSASSAVKVWSKTSALFSTTVIFKVCGITTGALSFISVTAIVIFVRLGQASSPSVA